MKRIYFVGLWFFFVMGVCEKNKPDISVESLSNDAYKGNVPIKVLTLGVFHFKFPNNDVAKIDKEERIDVLGPDNQKEIELIVEKLKKFKPTKIAVEVSPERQLTYDSLYGAYLQGEHTLSRNEVEQVGFRLAKDLSLEKLYCVDAWGDDFKSVKDFFNKGDSTARKEFMDFFYNHPDTLLESSRNDKRIFKSEGILAELIRLNSEKEIKKSLGDYLIGIFKYEIPDNKQFGVDFTTGWWFNRNLRIFRNIQRLNATREDRVLVIFGSGHMNLLNAFFDASPEYELLKVNEFLKR